LYFEVTFFSFAPNGAIREVRGNKQQENPMTEVPIIAQKAPYGTDVEEGKSYFWCACGRSKNQPFCDGSHKDTGLSPVKYTADKTGTVYFCGCKQSANQPLCDGTHSKI